MVGVSTLKAKFLNYAAEIIEEMSEDTERNSIALEKVSRA
jgi:hypothetical protein